MLDAKKRRNLAALAMQKKVAPAPYAKDKKLKAVAETVPSGDEETCSGLVFKRKQKGADATSAHSISDDQAPSYWDFPPSVSPPHDIVVQEGRGESDSEEDQWDPSSDPAFFLQRMLLSSKVRGRLENLEESPLMEHPTRQLGETLVANFFLLSKLWKSKELAKDEALQAAGLKRQVTELTLEVEELQKVHQKTKALLFGSPKRPSGYTRGTMISALRWNS